MPDVVTLNEELPRWLRVLELSPDPAFHQKRREGVEALVKQTSGPDIETLVRLTLKTKQLPSSDAIARTRQPFKEADDSFPSSGNERELQILCGATLAELFRRQGNVPSIAALAVSTATSFGVNKSELPFDLAEASEVAIARQAELHRRRPELGKLTPIEFPKGEFDKVAVNFQTQPDLSNIMPTLNVLIDASRVAFNMLAKRSSEGLASAGGYLAIQDEELEMLWWLVGERSDDLDRPFAKIPIEERPMVVAKELAGMTVYLPGPGAIKSLLARSGLGDADELPIVSCINACDVDWLRPLVDGLEPSPVTRPLHFAIKRKLETSDDTSWIPGWAATSGLDVEEKFSTLHLATQFYRERLLARWART